MRIITLLLLSIMATTALKAQTPTLFQNLYGGNATNSGVNNLYFGTVHNGNLYFNVRDSSGTYDVYRTDGTVGGTLLLKTITQVANFQVYNNAVYFGFVDVPNGGSQLWKTDGTVAGTQLVKAFGGNAVAPNTFTVYNNKLFFVADTSTTLQKRRLFVSDGTAAGTRILDANLYEAGSYYAVINNKLIFTASAELDSPQKKEPYITDGTQAGTVLLKDINPGSAGSNPTGFIPYNNKIYFSATTAAEGCELWATDGTTGGTTLVKDLNPGTGSGIPYVLSSAIVYNNKLFFGGDNGSTGKELFVTDGTVAGTQLVKDINAGATGSNVSTIIVLNGKLLFTCNDGTNGFELWTSDGTAAGTSLLMDINTGSNSGVYAIRAENQLCPDKLYFDADNGNNNIEPWITDGTVAGTMLLGDINPTTAIPASLDFETVYRKLNDQVYVAAYEPVNGRELYRVTDSCTGTNVVNTTGSIVVDAYPNPASAIVRINLGDIHNAVVSLYTATGTEVYRNDKANGTVSIDVEYLPTGIYTIMVQTISGRLAKKLIIN